MNGEVGITIATHGWIGTEMTRGKFMLEEGAEMQWKEEKEVSFNNFVFLFTMLANVTCVLPLTIRLGVLKVEGAISVQLHKKDHQKRMVPNE